jgi:hypothetical protein
MPTVLRLRTDSPMDVLLSIPPSLEALGGLSGLVRLAERVCTFGPRVKAQRRRWEVEAEKLKRELDQAHPHDRGIIEQQIENVASIIAYRPDFLEVADDEGDLDDLPQRKVRSIGVTENDDDSSSPARLLRPSLVRNFHRQRPTARSAYTPSSGNTPGYGPSEGAPSRTVGPQSVVRGRRTRHGCS